MAAVEVSSPELDLHEVVRWAMVVEPDRRKRAVVTTVLEQAGFGVAVVADAREALACLEIITPALIVVGDLPGASDLLDRARSIGIETTRQGNVVSEKLP
jgi:DNA-binding response OmpR family regulator